MQEDFRTLFPINFTYQQPGPQPFREHISPLFSPSVSGQLLWTTQVIKLDAGCNNLEKQLNSAQSFS